MTTVLELPCLLTPADCARLSELCFRQAGGSRNHDPFWHQRAIYDVAWRENDLEALRRLQWAAELEWGPVWPTAPSLVLWPAGHEGMRPHGDRGVNGEFPWRDYAAIVMLTDGFEGGGTTIGDRVVHPGLGNGVIFPGLDTLHGVEPVRGADRVTLVIWFCSRSTWPDPPPETWARAIPAAVAPDVTPALLAS